MELYRAAPQSPHMSKLRPGGPGPAGRGRGRGKNASSSSSAGTVKGMSASSSSSAAAAARPNVAVAVYGSSSPRTPDKYIQATTLLGEALGMASLDFVYGGGRYGAMNAACVGAKSKGARVVSVIHKMWVSDDHERLARGDIDELVVVDGADLRERKAGLLDRADVIISVPGGVGTFDELCEVLCMNGVGRDLRVVPVAIFNVDG